jgi:hypothetical protein
VYDYLTAFFFSSSFTEIKKDGADEEGNKEARVKTRMNERNHN